MLHWQRLQVATADAMAPGFETVLHARRDDYKDWGPTLAFG